MENSFKRLYQLFFSYSIGSVFEKSLLFFLIPLYSVYLGPEDFGIIGLMSVTTGFVSKCIAPPIISGVVRHYYAPEYSTRQSALVFNSGCYLLMVSAVFAAVFYLFNRMIAEVILGNPDLNDIARLYALILFFTPLSEFLLVLLRIRAKALYYVLVSWTRFLLSALVVVLGLIFFKIGILALVYGNLVSLCIGICMVFPFFCKLIKFEPSMRILRAPLRYGYPMIARSFSIFLIQFGDRYVLNILTNLFHVGLYSYGCYFASILNFAIVTPLANALTPMTLKQENDPRRLRSFLSANCTYFYFLAMFGYLGLSVFSKEIVFWMSHKDEFLTSWIVIPLVAFAHLQHGLGYFFGMGAVMAKKSVAISLNVVVAGIFNLLMNFLFIPIFGILGAAMATLLTYMLWNMLRIYQSLKFYDLRFDQLRLLLITATGFSIVVMAMLSNVIGSNLIRVSIKLLLWGMYPLLLLKLGFFTQTEKEKMALVLNAVFMKYVKMVRPAPSQKDA